MHSRLVAIASLATAAKSFALLKIGYFGHQFTQFWPPKWLAFFSFYISN
jgi:hypothetical protein